MTLFKTDRPRPIDRQIDYFGEPSMSVPVRPPMRPSPAVSTSRTSAA